MPLDVDVIRRAVIVAHAHKAGFVELVGMAELDRTTAFQGASLRGTDLRRQDFAGFDFTEAEFDGADVRGADFSRTVGLTRQMFQHARSDYTTKWPRYMQVQAVNKGTTRVQLELSSEAADNIKSLMNSTGGTSRAEVFRNALRLLRWATEQVEKGHQIASIDSDGKVITEVRMPAFDALKRKPDSR